MRLTHWPRKKSPLLAVFLGLIIMPLLSNGTDTEGMGELILHKKPKLIPQIPFLDLDGNSVIAEDFIGSTLVINFWATWCAPCIEEMPTLEALQLDVEGKNIKIIPISQDRTGNAAVRSFIEKNFWNNLSFFISQDNSLVRALNIRGLPTTIIVGTDGKEIGRLEGITDWASNDIKEFLLRVK